MRYEMVPIVLAEELEEAIKTQYDITVDIKEIFFKYEPCLSGGMGYLLTFSEEDIWSESVLNEEEYDEERSERLCVMNYLYDTIYKDTGCDFIYVQGIQY